MKQPKNIKTTCLTKRRPLRNPEQYIPLSHKVVAPDEIREKPEQEERYITDER